MGTSTSSTGEIRCLGFGQVHREEGLKPLVLGHWTPPNSLLTILFFSFSLFQQGDCVISKVLTFDLTKYPDANPNPNEQ